MFSQVSVCPKGESGLLHAGIHPPGQTPPWADTPLGRHPLWADTTPWADTPWADTPLGRPPAQCMLGYGQQVGGTHPTGIHSC